MTIVFGGGTAGAIVKLVCPHCKTEQTRARQAAHRDYECKNCHRRFTRDEAVAQSKSTPPPRLRKR